MLSRKTILALLPAILLNAAFIHLFLFSEGDFVWGNALNALSYALFLSLIFWGTYGLVKRALGGR